MPNPFSTVPQGLKWCSVTWRLGYRVAQPVLSAMPFVSCWWNWGQRAAVDREGGGRKFVGGMSIPPLILPFKMLLGPALWIPISHTTEATPPFHH